jgi:peptide-methionine (S)-S-oxide reductase
MPQRHAARSVLLGALLAAACGGNASPRTDSPPPTPPTETAMNRDAEPRKETATLGAGCFWCIEAVLERVDGVASVDSGYMGGTIERPTYEQVCSGATGHAEVVQVVFDPAKIGYRELLDWFFRAHDPTTLNRQGNDYGTQYRSAIFVHSEAQRQEAEAAKAAAQAQWRDPIVTEITAASKFWPAEDYHQDFFRRNPNQAYCRATIPPKLKKLGLDGKK